MNRSADAPPAIRPKREEWQRHWPIVLVGFLGFGFYSLMPNALGLYVSPLSHEFGWTRTQVMAGLSASTFAAIFLSPLVGGLVDRFGSRRVALPGLVLTSLVIASFGFISGSFTQWISLWILLSVVMLLIKSTVWTAIVTRTFVDARSLALAVTMSGTSFAQSLAPPLARWMVDDIGWRNSFIAFGLGWGLVALLPAMLFLFDRDRMMSAPSPSAAKAETDSKAVTAPQTGLTLSQALRAPPLIRIAIAIFLVMFTGIGILINQVPILVDAGIERDQAAYLTSLYGIAAIAGKLATGWLMDRYSPRLIGALTVGLSGLAFLILLDRSANIPLIALGLLMIGYAAGTKLQICAYLTGLYGGLLNYGKIFGVMSSLTAVAVSIGPLSAAYTFDLTGSYAGFIWAASALSLVAAWLLLGLGPVPDEFGPEQTAQ